jgi:predicted component of type VI protein secretion system
MHNQVVLYRVCKKTMISTLAGGIDRSEAIMKVRLRVLHGKLQDKEGHGRGMEVEIPGPRFVIGSAQDCSMCCKSTSVRPHHCEIYLDQHGVGIRSLDPESETFINDQRMQHQQMLHDGDLLRVGRLEFEVLIEASAAELNAAEDDRPDPLQTEQELSDMLVKADEQEREFRQQHPELRELRLEPTAPKTEPKQQTDDQAGDKKKRKKKPGKLPKELREPPAQQAEDSTEAAEEALRRMFRPS